MADLINAARAKSNLDNLTTTTAEDTTLSQLISAVSATIENYCRRTFSEMGYDERHDGNGTPILRLNQYPILEVEAVAGNPVAVLRIRNTDASNRRATVAVTDTGLTLIRVSSGTTTEDTSVTWASNVTLTAVTDAVNALGNGWSAELVGDYATWPSADLTAPQGALSVRDRAADLFLHTEELSTFDIDADTGLLRRDRFGSVWAVGSKNYRVRYTAGYATIPADIQEACAEWVAQLFWKTKSDPGTGPGHPPPGVARMLEPWRRFGW